MESNMRVFENIKRVNKYDSEYWSARELSQVLEYNDYRNFQNVIERAKESCKNSGQSIKYHFGELTEMIEIGRSASRGIPDVMLSRYACYLVMQNADPSKGVVAAGQTYFAIQTRRQEVQDELVEDQKRLILRGEITTHNKNLAQTAGRAGVENFAVFTNFGYMGLYGGLDSKKIHTHKQLAKSQKILDHMGSEELAANLFRATQTEAKLRRENIQGQVKADQTHFSVGKKIRQTIKELGGTMPEKLMTPDSIQAVEKRVKKIVKAKKGSLLAFFI
jgi:DNA-damage-inducible protein D